MAYLSVPNVRISGISAAVPRQKDDISSLDMFDTEAASRFTASTGIASRRRAGDGVCSSDLCTAAASKLMDELGWSGDDISALVFVSQTPDYTLPATSAVIQSRLGLGKDCYALDISLGCSGWVYGMSVISSMLSLAGGGGKALLLCGDTILKFCSRKDKSTYPLFGDAGSATALEYREGTSPIVFGMNTDGNGYKAIFIRDGGYRHPVRPESFEEREKGEGIVSNDLSLELDGMDVFAFGINKAPESVNGLTEHFSIDRESVDYFIFHQANMFMNEKIRKKLKLPPEKVPYSMDEFGNTSCASIPLTMVSRIGGDLEKRSLSHIACGFGVGLSWGSVFFHTDGIVCPSLIEL